MSEFFFVREISKDDVEVINSWRNDKELINKLGSPFRYIDKAVDTNWLENYFNNRNNCVRLAICEVQSSKIIGAVYILNIDWVSRNCELAIWIGSKECRGKGAGFYSVQKALSHAFQDLNLHRVYLTVLEDNIPAINLYKKTGFSSEGIHRESVYKNGKYFNMIQMSILSKEFMLDK